MLALVFCPPADLSLLLLLLDNLDEVATTEKEVDPFCGGQQSKQTVRPPSVGNGRRGAERREMKERGGCTGGHQSRPLPVSLPLSSPILLPFALSLLLSDFNRVFVDPPSPPLFLAALSFPFLPFLLPPPFFFAASATTVSSSLPPFPHPRPTTHETGGGTFSLFPHPPFLLLPFAPLPSTTGQ